MKNIVFQDVIPYSHYKSTDVSEESFVSIFKVEDL
jgi:hypothetical protein